MTTPTVPSLAGITLLQRLPEAERKVLTRRCAFKTVAAGEVILDRFSASNGICFLVSDRKTHV